MNSLRRITIEYSEQEDRIRLAGLTQSSQTVIMWFTMRLMSRLIVHCLGLLERGSLESKIILTENEKSKESIQNFVQKSAEEQIIKETPVEVSVESPEHLIVEIDVKNTDSGLSIIFKGKSDSVHNIFFNGEQLRQWLAMLYSVWQKAEWPKTMWPDWIEKDHSLPTPSEISVH